MDFFKKHEILFALVAILFSIPLILQYFGIIHVINVSNNHLVVPFFVILAIIPAIIWMKIFNKENPEAKTTLIMAFLAGCSSTIPVFFYQKLFQSGQSGNFIFFKAEAVNFQNNIAEILGYNSLQHLTQAAGDNTIWAVLGIFFVFMGVGALEEIVKQVVVNTRIVLYLAFFALITGVGYLAKDFSALTVIQVVFPLIFYFVFLRLLVRFMKFQSIDDVIEVAIVSALGFAFVENIHYFMGKFGDISTSAFIFFVLVRVTVVSVVHVLCSGIMGYHIGLAHFAKPVLQDEIHEGRKFTLLQWGHKILDLPSDAIFRFEQVILGVTLAVLVHAAYDFFMQLQFQIFGFIPMFALIMPIYFIGGVWYLFSLLEDKEDHKKFGKLVIKEEYEVID